MTTSYVNGSLSDCQTRYREIISDFETSLNGVVVGDDDLYSRQVILEKRDKKLARLFNDQNKDYASGKSESDGQPVTFTLPSGCDRNYRIWGIDPTYSGKITPQFAALWVTSGLIGGLLGAAVEGPYGIISGACTALLAFHSSTVSTTARNMAFDNVKQQSDRILEKFFTPQGEIIHFNAILVVNYDSDDGLSIC